MVLSLLFQGQAMPQLRLRCCEGGQRIAGFAKCAVLLIVAAGSFELATLKRRYQVVELGCRTLQHQADEGQLAR